MTVKYWEIREDRRIVALVDFWDIKAGDVGDGARVGNGVRDFAANANKEQ